MRRLPAPIVALIVVMVLATVAAAGAVAWAIQVSDRQWRMGPGMMGPGYSGTPGWGDESWGPRMPGMMGRAGAATELEYLAAMIAHHEEAVAAAGELTRSERSEMRTFGKSIVKTQTAQIGQMQTWLKNWYPSQSKDVDYQPMMRDLSELSGSRLDEQFLQDMIGHHMAAVMMSQQLLWRGTDHDQVARLARTIRDEQHDEIVQMQRWLAQWYDTDWRGGMGWGNGSGCWGSDRGRGPGMMWGVRP